MPFTSMHGMIILYEHIWWVYQCEYRVEWEWGEKRNVRNKEKEMGKYEEEEGLADKREKGVDIG